MTKRVLLAGLFHETHTFLEGVTPLSDWSVRRGEELLQARGDGSPLSGVIEVADLERWELVPAIDLRATPSAMVADEVVELFWDELARAATASPLDGVYLVLHGAMVSESFPDVEGEIIRRVRELPETAELPVCGVLDLHGNISRITAERTEGLIAYRTNPHTDARQTAVDGARLLATILNTGRRPQTLWAQPPVIWPPTGTGTADEPMKTLEAMARRIETSDPDVVAVNVFGGFSFADVSETGVSFGVVTFGDPESARGWLDGLVAYCIEHCEEGNVVDPPLAEVMPAVLGHVERGETPVVIVEPADNVGGGAPGDATTLLRTLLEHDVDGSVVVINDPGCVELLADAAPGDSMRLSIGGKGSPLTEGPVELEVELISTSDGAFTLEDRHSHMASAVGIHIEMGPSAVVRHGGITILLTTLKTAPMDLRQLRSQGITPEEASVIGVKAAVAHRQAYDPITAVSFTVDTPGPCSSDVAALPFERVRRPVFPLDRLEEA